MSKLSTMFRSISYGPCSHTGVTCVASDFGGNIFTSVPLDKALGVITERLQEDDTLTSRTEMTIPQIVELLDFCLNTTYFIYDGAYYQQTHGAAMGSPISPLVANCYME